MSNRRGLPWGTRLKFFLYGTPHLAGCVAVLVGLGLYLLGVIEHAWWLICAGLYLGGWLLGQAFVDDREMASILDETRLQQELERLLGEARNRLPPAADKLMESIAERARTLIPVLDDLAERGVIGDQVRHEVLTALTRYLPDTLASYLALPAAYLRLQRQARQDPARLLTDQLQLIDQHLARCIEDAFGEHAAELAIQGHFLAEKMGRGELPG